MEDLEKRLASYIERHLPDARGVRVEGLARIAGGASRETFRFVLHYDTDAGPVSRRLILRRDLPSSLLESERRIEFAAYKGFADTAVPVPEMLWLEEDTSHLGHPFFIAQELHGFQADPMLLQTEPYRAKRAEIGRRKWQILGEIARTDPAERGYLALFDPPRLEDIWSIQLDYWDGVLQEDAVRPEPIVRAAIRWMRRNPPPPPPRLSVVHGDYRTANFLYDADGKIHAILDWEMTHVGDPLEDLAWSLNPVFRFAKDHLAGGLLPREEAIAAWESTSGMKVDPAALHWWQLLASVKGQALWVSAARNAISGPARELIHFGTAWFVMNAQDRVTLELMGQ